MSEPTAVALAKAVITDDMYRSVTYWIKSARTLAKALIRRVEGVEVIRFSPGRWQCPNCKLLREDAPNYCGQCGTRLIWPKT